MRTRILLRWKARESPLDDCAAKACATLEAMKALDFAPFYLTGESRAEALARPFVASPSAVRELVSQGVNRRDDNQEPIPKLGYSCALWSGDADGECWGLSILCGNWSGVGCNRVAVEFPPAGRHGWASASARQRELFDRLCAIWNPDEGVLSEASAIDYDDKARLVLTKPPFARLGVDGV